MVPSTPGATATEAAAVAHAAPMASTASSATAMPPTPEGGRGLSEKESGSQHQSQLSGTELWIEHGSPVQLIDFNTQVGCAGPTVQRHRGRMRGRGSD
jgi:hypothetical protein